jgi:hypothetical protein
MVCSHPAEAIAKVNCRHLADGLFYRPWAETVLAFE